MRKGGSYQVKEIGAIERVDLPVAEAAQADPAYDETPQAGDAPETPGAAKPGRGKRKEK